MEREDTTAPAYNIALEESVLGSLLLWCDDVYNDVTDIIHSPNVFYSAKSRRIYEAILFTREEGIPVDIITVGETVKKQCGFDAIGGEWTLQRIADGIKGTVNIITQCRMLVEHYIRRESREKLYRLYQQTANPATDVFDIIDKTERLLKDLKDQVSSDSEVKISGIRDGYERYKEVVTADSSRRVYYGIPSIDSATRGTWPGEVGGLGAKQKTGKSALAQQIAEETAAKTYEPGLFFSLEMPLEMMFERSAQRTLDCTGRDVENRIKNDSDFNPVFDKLKNFYVVDRSFLSVDEIERTIIYAQERMFHSPLSVVIIDYLSLVRHGRRNEYEGVSDSVRRIKAMAKNTHTPIILILQVNRSNRRFDPITGDSFRDTGVIDESVDNAIGLWGVAEDNPKPNTLPEQKQYGNGDFCMMAGLIYSKRGGAGLAVPIGMNPRNMRITEYTNLL